MTLTIYLLQLIWIFTLRGSLTLRGFINVSGAVHFVSQGLKKISKLLSLLGELSGLFVMKVMCEDRV